MSERGLRKCGPGEKPIAVATAPIAKGQWVEITWTDEDGIGSARPVEPSPAYQRLEAAWTEAADGKPYLILPAGVNLSNNPPSGLLFESIGWGSLRRLIAAVADGTAQSGYCDGWYVWRAK